MVRQVNDRAMKWRPATVLEQLSDRSYLVRNDQDNIVRRNRVALQALPIPAQTVPTMKGRTGQTNQAERSRTSTGENRSDKQLTTEERTEEETLEPTTTKAGRLVKRPAYLQDYI